MKTVVATVVAFIVVLGLGAFSYYYLHNTTNDLLGKTATLEKSSEARDWNKADHNFSDLKSTWDRTSSKWTVLLDHQELDNINITMARASKYMETRDRSHLLAEIAELKLLFKHIPEKEGLNLKNIL